MLTLFTKSPLPEKANSILLKNFGYRSKKGNNKKELHTTINAVSYNRLKGKSGFKVGIRKDNVVIIDDKKNILDYWDKETLKNSFERKLPKLIFVKAESKGKGLNEQFWFNEAWLLTGFDFENFLKMLKKGIILVDIRIGQYLDGRPHDHGTGFRVHLNKLDLCFQNRKRIM